MGKPKDLSTEQKSSVIAFICNTEYSQREIARKCGESQFSVKHLSKKVHMNQPVVAARAGNCGRKPLVNPRGQRFLRNLAMQNRRASHSDIRKRFQEAGFSGSVATVRRNLYSMGFKYRTPIKKPKLTPSMVQKRLAWANLHTDMSLEDWQTVCFSDETTFQIMDDIGPSS
ncbi:hypothetical protein ANTQUA_LOCUS5882 [Anthophora quadrimaculata]